MTKEEDLKEKKNLTEVHVRKGWKDVFQEMTFNGDDIPLDNDLVYHSWDEEEWKW